MRRNQPAVLAAILGLALCLGCGDQPTDEPPVAELPPPEPEEVPPEIETVVYDLYFPGEGGRLYAEGRELPRHAELTERARAIVEAILAGPESEGLVPPLPQGVSLTGIYPMGENELVVALGSEEGPPPSSGSSREMLTVYSLVNSLAFNLEEIERVTLLWNDRQQTTFAGHLDTTRALAPQGDLVARRPG